MFTGIVEEVGTVRAVERLGTDARLVLHGPTVVPGMTPGASIAVAGVCLTATGFPAPGEVSLDVMPETLTRTTLGDLTPGARINLERALPATGRLDGHLVQGHVDGVGRLVSRTPGPRWDDLAFELPAGLAPYLAEKGSIAVAGVSLTVTWVDGNRFGVSLVPTTLAGTTLGELAVGDGVNLEVDVVAKYVERLLAARGLIEEGR